MKNWLVLFLLLILPWMKGVGQCPKRNIVLNTQAQVDSFTLGYPNCSELDYNLTISGSITDLNSLVLLKKCQRLSIVMTYQLTNLKGLSGLKEVGEVEISNNNVLVDLSDFQPIKLLELTISNNQSLKLIDCFDDLGFLRNAKISGNPKLENINAKGFKVDSLQSLVINSNDNLIKVDSFDLCGYIKDIHVFENINLQYIGFLSRLDKSGATLNLNFNPKLLEIDLSGLSNLNYTYFWVSNNNMLQRIIFPKIKNQEIQSIQIDLNPNLTTIENSPFSSIRNLQLFNNTKLESLEFLNGTAKNEVFFTIQFNNGLKNVDPLIHLKKAGILYIANNDSLTDLFGLDSLTSVNEIIIRENVNLRYLSNFKSISTSIYTSFKVINNPKLLEIKYTNPIHVLPILQIENNDELKTINISSLEFSLSLDVSINENNSLTAIEIQNVFRMNALNIEGNKSLNSIAISNIEMSTEMMANINFNPKLKEISLPQISNIHTLRISNNSDLYKIGNFNALKKLEHLVVVSNNSLVDISGLQNLNQVKSIEFWQNASLKTLKQLKSLVKVDLDINISYNQQLLSIFENLESIQGKTSITNNPMLTDISGLRKVKNLANYVLINNPLLTKCAIESICISLENDSANYFLLNGTGCSSANEVKEQCISNSQNVTVYPNPAHNQLNFTSFPLDQNAIINIYDIYGRQVFYKLTTQPELDISALANGTYILEVKSDKINYTKKFVKY